MAKPELSLHNHIETNLFVTKFKLIIGGLITLFTTFLSMSLFSGKHFPEGAELLPLLGHLVVELVQAKGFFCQCTSCAASCRQLQPCCISLEQMVNIHLFYPDTCKNG
jgi:hypothetical protein